jgi:hypothetical protein
LKFDTRSQRRQDDIVGIGGVVGDGVEIMEVEETWQTDGVAVDKTCRALRRLVRRLRLGGGGWKGPDERSGLRGGWEDGSWLKDVTREDDGQG